MFPALVGRQCQLMVLAWHQPHASGRPAHALALVLSALGRARNPIPFSQPANRLLPPTLAGPAPLRAEALCPPAIETDVLL